MQGSSFATCPLCSKSVPKALLDIHASSCSPAADSDAPTAQHAQHGRRSRSPQPSAQHQQAHSAAEGVQQGDSARTIADAMHPGRHMPEAVARSHAKPAGQPAVPQNNAFAHMMQQQRERSQAWTFFLGARPDGSLFWHLWRDDRAPAAGVPVRLASAGSCNCTVTGSHIAMLRGVSMHACAAGAPDAEERKRLLAGARWSAASQAPLAALECRTEGASASKAPVQKVLSELVAALS